MAIKTILVEDNPTIRENLLPAMRELADIEVIAVAESQGQAGEALRALEPIWELIVIDLFLAEGSGLGVLRDCAARRADQTALVLTNYISNDVRKRCADLGADGVFDKSTELDAFFERCLQLRA